MMHTEIPRKFMCCKGGIIYNNKRDTFLCIKPAAEVFRSRHIKKIPFPDTANLSCVSSKDNILGCFM